MKQYFCDCLNVIINVRESREVPGSSMVYSSSTSNSFDFDREDDKDVNADTFFTNKLLDVQLGISGIEVARQFLLKDRSYGDWLVYTCLNCSKDTHCVHGSKGLDRVLLPYDLYHEKSLFEETQLSTSYSNVFKVKLGEFSHKPTATLNMKKVSAITTKVNLCAEKVLIAEEEAMNERIRIFKETEEQKFREFKLKTSKEREKLTRSVRKHENSQMDSLFDSFNESYFGDSKQSEERDMSTELPHFKGRGFVRGSLSTSLDNSSQIAQSLPTSSFLSPKSKKLGSGRSRNRTRSQSFSDSDDVMFPIEGFQEDADDCKPFAESDDDSSGGDATSLESSGGYSIPTSASRRLNAGDRVYATSVPVSIPLFENMKNSYELESDEEEEEHALSPNHIADSIKALARSMQDSTSMFGDLPRPRVNTMNNR